MVHAARTALVLVLALGLLVGCDRTEPVQRGYRGTGMVQQYMPANLKAMEDAIAKIPKPLRAANRDAPTAAEEFENVQVLGDLSKAEFARMMLSIKSWVAPEAGCDYCHNAPDYASDVKYTKRVAREMLKMTRHINSDWKDHVAGTGVTCYTCHRGKPVPANVWFTVPPPQLEGYTLRKSALPRAPTPSTARTVLSSDALTDFLLGENPVRTVGLTPLKSDNHSTIGQTRSSYALMMVMSESLGVNCTFCHNSRAFAAWDLSTPQRATAWHGIRMARDLNQHYMVPTTGLFPTDRLGPTGDVPKIYCATCHQGANKPLNGVATIKAYPELLAPKDRAAAQPPGPVAALAAATTGAR